MVAQQSAAARMGRQSAADLATMMAVALVIAFVPWIVYLLPYVLNLYTPL